ncbi:class I SAM-dependent methyltransferase [Candidatus Parcubacteria bacterium]|nr:class I SAM-dependent methyltransferase [Candidatus Parcubacteria bacterium]
MPRSRVLDVGCGSGWATLILTGRTLRCETACVDRDARAITFANRALRRRGREIRCRRCYAENLGDCFKPGRFDAAVAVHALHHFDEPARALRQMRKVLKPGGQLALAELDPTYGEELDDCPRYSLMKIMAFVRAAGFKQVRSWHQRPGVLLLAACR